MKKYSTTTGHEFTIDFASGLNDGYGCKRIKVYVMSDNGDKKEFSSRTCNMSDFDEAIDLEGQEKYDAFYELIQFDIDDEVSEWLFELENEN